MRYNPSEIEPKWQRFWEEQGVFRAGTRSGRPKFYVLDMFPYPSGHGLHVGHAKGYVGSDIVARFMRMRGFDVLHPMGWDAFGLPAERQAIREGIHPAEVTRRNIAIFRQQMKLLGLSYDWDREISTADPEYYRWTQWIFLQLYRCGLAYQAEVPVNWCPALNTVLANEEVKDGVYVETGDPVERRLMRQWMLKITAYADRLLNDLELVDWPEGIKEMQRNWIGRSEGARVSFSIHGGSDSFDVFTTRADTLFGCTYCVLAPEHPLIQLIATPDRRDRVKEYAAAARQRSERDRLAQAEARTGEFTGAYAVVPVDGRRVPIWVSDYVIASYGTGAVFGCPAHDERDHAFALRFGLPIIEVVEGGNVREAAFTDDGKHVNSGFLNGLMIAEAKSRITEWLKDRGLGEAQVNYRLRDWLFSRQRYWGEPIPVVYLDDGTIVAVDEASLPVLLPHLDEFTATPDGRPPLARAHDWMAITGSKVGHATRETNTMPQWAGSCWYYLRFADPKNDRSAWSQEAAKRWLPVDLYVGGAEHATLHLLYARFWHKVLFDLGLVTSPEPFKKLFNQGMILSRSFQDARGKYYYPNEVVERDGAWSARENGVKVQTHIEKMSKSRYNVVTPDEIIADYGADSLRLYEAFLGPLEEGALWQSDNIPGVRRFLDRAWRLFFSESQLTVDAADDKELEILLHKTIKKVTEDIERLRLNTAVSQLMIFVNEATKRGRISKGAQSVLARLLSPFAPHAAEELWRVLGHSESIALASWPAFDPSKAEEEVVTVAVQINGRTRGSISVPRGAPVVDVQDTALKESRLTRFLEGKTVTRAVFVPDRLINLLVQ